MPIAFGLMILSISQVSVALNRLEKDSVAHYPLGGTSLWNLLSYNLRLIKYFAM